jgi:hypothetical protein
MKLSPAGAVAVAVASCCAVGTSAGISAASAQPASGTTPHAAASEKPGGHKLATNTKVPKGGSKAAPTKDLYGGVDRQNALAVGKAFVRASYTFDAATQASTNPATVRSTLWCTPSLRAKMLAELPRGSPGGQWIEWAVHKAVTTVAVEWAPQSGAPPETTEAAYESYNVTVTAHGDHGWTGAPDYYVLWLTLSRTGPKRPWEVASFEVQPWFPSTSNK